MFLAYINDLESQVFSGVKKFADDTKLYAEVTFQADADSFSDLNRVFSWSQDW